jgi:hypothetical protein
MPTKTGDISQRRSEKCRTRAAAFTWASCTALLIKRVDVFLQRRCLCHRVPVY